MNYPFHVFETDKQLEVLYKLFDMETPDKKLLEKKLSKLLLPAGGFLQDGLTYDAFITRIAKKRDITLPVDITIAQRERALFEKISIQNLEGMSEQERADLQKQLITQAQEKGMTAAEMGSITSLATIGAAQLSGMGVYLMASSAIGAITSLAGVTLPFAFYTGMSSVISVVIGPVGLILAAIPLYKTFKDVRSWDDLTSVGNRLMSDFKLLASGNYKLAEIVFTYFASMRIMNKEEHMQRLKSVQTEIDLIDLRRNRLKERESNEQELVDSTQSEIEIQNSILVKLKRKLDLQQQELRRSKHELESINYNYRELEIKNDNLTKNIERLDA